MHKNKFEVYDHYVRNGMLEYHNRDYEKSLPNFKKAFEIISDENVSDYFYAASAALHLDKPDVAKKLIIKAIIRTKASEDYFLRFKGFDDFRKNKIFEEIKNNYNKYITQFYANLDHPEIYREIDSLFGEDQRVRKNDVGIQEQNKIDSLNVMRLMEITKKYGWQEKGWIILWHQRFTFRKNNYVWTFFRPYINKQIQEGNMRKDFWAMFEDQEAIIKEKKQIYGTYMGELNEYPIEDIEHVDERRKKVGLAPLWYMKKIYDVNLPKNYTYPKNLKL